MNPDAPDPLWAQVADHVRRQVAEGSLAPGARLAPERELCLHLGVSRVTLRRALGRLVEEGVLTASHGRGWYVGTAAKTDWPNSLESFSETAARKGLAPASRVLRADVHPATLDEADLLMVAAGAPLFHLERVRLLDGGTVGLDYTRVPLAVAPGLPDADFAARSLFEVLTEAGREPSRADTTIEAGPADARVAGLLEVETGAPLLVMTEIVVDAADRRLFHSRLHYRGDRYRLRTSFARGAGGGPRPDQSAGPTGSQTPDFIER
ncbi:GntR family transcriptional regulator [Microbispora sp. ATCC PTA-5024]|uniref:GntR family transcriptional regulator n=1 Tax=Microbispora sp. ATCC PTA-5024 TaxID=316330 RepID=UPI001E6119B6|nr:GntR family transcriptional regulator [Microbispora sp. ATCC PTA-5024]